jgi:hemerythrin-like domain-containing protein
MARRSGRFRRAGLSFAPYENTREDVMIRTRDFTIGKRLSPLIVLAGEHRLIERMLRLLGKEREGLRWGERPRTGFLRDAVDFFRIYVALFHDAKEERILFPAFRKKDLPVEQMSALEDFLVDHTEERKRVYCLKTFSESCEAGDRDAEKHLGHALDELIGHASAHMASEEKLIVHVLSACFNDREAENVLKGFHEYDAGRTLHDKYTLLVAKHENRESEESVEAVLSNRRGNWYSEDHVLQASAR